MRKSIHFRPHQGIIYFNISTRAHDMESRADKSFRPHQGII